MTEYKAQQFTVEPDPGDPGAELGLRKLDVYMAPAAQIEFGNDSNTHLSFRSVVGGSMTEHMLIDANGNVGIGTASSGEKLEINGTVKATAFNGDGLNLKNLDGSQISTGTIADARLPRISHGNLTDVAAADPGSGDAQANKHVSNAQTRQWENHLGDPGNPHGTTALQIDNQGGTNRITAQINAGTGIINESRIDAAIARNSRFDMTTGHDHNGANSKKISPANLLGVSANVTAANLNILTAGVNSDASSQHYHSVIPARNMWYKVPMKALPVGYVWYSQPNHDYAYNPPVFRNEESRLIADPNKRSAAFIPLYLPNYANLSQMTIDASIWNGTPEVQVTFLRGNTSLAMTSITSTGTKTVSLAAVIDNTYNEYSLRIVIVKASTDYTAINSIRFNYSLNRLF